MPRTYLAIDLGAESGRVVAGLWNGKTIQLEELHRFPNGPVHLGNSLRWNVLGLWAETQKGLALAAKKYGKDVVSVGADTWGVDYVLLTAGQEMLGQPFAYRDARTNGMMERAFKRVPRSDIFRQTGLQFMQFNTLFQLLAQKHSNPFLLETADVLLMMPDFIHWALCGSRVVEFTNGTTTQCMHPLKRTWAMGLLKEFAIPTHIFPEVVPPGTALGQLRAGVAERAGLPRIAVVAPPTHDTASAVAGVPTANTGRANWAYISSGTWSLMGVEVKKASLVSAHAGVEPDERRRAGWHVPPAQEHHGLVAGATMQARFRRTRAHLRIRRTGATGRQSAGAPVYREPGRCAVPEPARHARGDPGLLP